MRLTIIISILIITITYVIILKLWKEQITWKLSNRMTVSLKHIHYSSLFLCIFSLILFEYFSLSFKGLWTSRIIIIITILTGIFFHLIANKVALKKIEETYFKFLSYFPIIVGIFSLIPFIGIVVILSLVGQLFMPVEKIYFEDENLRIQSSFVGVLGSPEMKVYKKKMFFDERVDFEYISINEIDSHLQ